MITHVKAVYRYGDNAVSDHNYSCELIYSPAAARGTIVKAVFRRINDRGYGVWKCLQPLIVAYKFTKDTLTGVMGYKKGGGGDVIETEFEQKENVTKIEIQLRSQSPSLGAVRSQECRAEIMGAYGMYYQYYAIPLLEQAAKYARGEEEEPTTVWITKVNWNSLYLSRTTTGTAYSANTHYKKGQDATKAMILEADAAGVDITTLDWWQWQYALLRTEAPYLVTSAEAQAYFVDNNYTKITGKAIVDI